MATPKERAINVRRTNFKIGFDNSEIQSDYQSKFLFLPLQEKSENLYLDKDSKLKRSFLIDKSYNNSKNHFLSSNQQDYQKNQKTLPASISKEQYEEITKSHAFINPIEDKNKHVSESKQNYQSKQIDTEGFKLNQKLKKELSKHAHIFDYNQKNCQSIYQQSINKMDYESAKNNKIITSQIANNQKKDLKQDHIYFGFKDKNERYPKLAENHKEEKLEKYDNQKVNYKLGTSKLDFQSTNKKFEAGSQNFETIIKNKEYQKNMVNYLRGSHFELGNQGNHFQSEQQVKFIEKPFCQPKMVLDDKLCNIKFHQKNDYDTVNKLIHNKKDLPTDKAVYQKEDNVHFGSSDKDHTTENRSQFDKKVRILDNIEKAYDQMKAHELFQKDHPSDFKSTTQDTHYKFDQYIPNNFDPNMALEIRKAHFQLGHQNDPNITSNKEIGKIQKGICNEDFEMAENLRQMNRKTNLLMGKDKQSYLSQYKAIHHDH